MAGRWNLEASPFTYLELKLAVGWELSWAVGWNTYMCPLSVAWASSTAGQPQSSGIKVEAALPLRPILKSHVA